jgi:outer membrane lipoprotein-sorting protein
VPRICRLCILTLALCVAGACAPKRFTPPSDPGSPLSEFQQVHQQVVAGCATVKTFTAEIALSGRAGSEKLRGRVHAGFERPGSMRLEGIAPFGAPAFILAARGETATLLLPRDARVVRGARAEQILGALAGVALAPADLQAVLTGCVVPQPRASAGRLHGRDLASIDLEGGATVYLRRMGGRWVLIAARRGEWQIEYTAWQGQFPTSVRLQSETPVRVDLTASLSQVEANVDLDAAAFVVTVPPNTDPMSLDELREAGPLRGQ